MPIMQRRATREASRRLDCHSKILACFIIFASAPAAKADVIVGQPRKIELPAQAKPSASIETLYPNSVGGLP